jgi:ankyrin repeat protein
MACKVLFFDYLGVFQNGMTPLMVAAWVGNLEIVQLLISGGGNPNLLSEVNLFLLQYVGMLESPFVIAVWTQCCAMGG